MQLELIIRQSFYFYCFYCYYNNYQLDRFMIVVNAKGKKSGIIQG